MTTRMSSAPVLDDEGRPEPPSAAPETETLLGFLEFLRATVRWKCDGLDDEALHSTPLPTSMSLGGLLTHLAWVEDHWFGQVLAGRSPSAPWATMDWAENPEGEWDFARERTGVELRSFWDDAVQASRRDWRTAISAPDFALEKTFRDRHGRDLSARWVLTHMIEEYARHCGHADLLREAIDGSTGE